MPSDKGTWDVSSYLYKQVGSLWEVLDRFIESWPTNRRQNAPSHRGFHQEHTIYSLVRAVIGLVGSVVGTV